MEVEISLKKLDEMYVITKQFAGNKYFTRRSRRSISGYKCDLKVSNNCFIFDTMIAATSVCTELNAGRKKLKHKIESASRYFCSDIKFEKNYTGKIIVTTKFIPLEDMSKVLKSNKKEALEELIRIKNWTNDRLNMWTAEEKTILERYKKSIEYAEKEKMESLEQREKNLKEYTNTLHKLCELDYDNLLKSIETEQDKKFRILFGGLE